MQIFNALTFEVNQFDIKRGSTRFECNYSFLSKGTQNLYCDIHFLLDRFTKIVKSSKMTIDIFTSFTKELKNIFHFYYGIENEYKIKSFYDYLFSEIFQNNKFNAKNHDLYKFQNRILGILGATVSIAIYPLIMKLYIHKDFVDKFNNIKHDRILTLKKTMYLMALIRGIFAENEIEKKSLILHLSYKNPYDKLFDFIESEKLYSVNPEKKIEKS